MKIQSYIWAIPTAEEHARADGRCNRVWACACGACQVVRANAPKARIEQLKSLSRQERNGKANQ